MANSFAWLGVGIALCAIALLDGTASQVAEKPLFLEAERLEAESSEDFVLLCSVVAAVRVGLEGFQTHYGCVMAELGWGLASPVAADCELWP